MKREIEGDVGGIAAGGIIRALDMLVHRRRLQPLAPILLKRLHARLELGLLQGKVVDGADARDAHAGVAAAAAVHEGAADAAEAVFHVVARGDGVVLAEARELVFATGVLEGFVLDDEVGGEHACRDLAAVGAVADEGIHQAVAFCRHFYLDSAAVASGCCCAIALAVGAFGWEVDLL